MKTVIVWSSVAIIVLMCLFPPCRKGSGYWVIEVRKTDYRFLCNTNETDIETTHLVLQCVVVALLAGCLFWTVEKRQERLKSKTGESGRQDKQGHEATAAKGRNRLLALVAVTGLTVGLIGVSHLKSQANGLKSEVAVLTDDNEDLKSRTDDVESRVDDLESKLDRR